MKLLYAGTAQTIILDHELANGLTLKFTVFGEDGNPVDNSAGNPLKDIALTYNSTSKRYEASVVIGAEVPEQYLRIWFAGSSLIPVRFMPEDYLLKQVPSAIMKSEIVPVGYFIEYGIAETSKVDPYLSQGLEAFIGQNYEGLKSILAAAESELEIKSSIYFSPREFTERQDYYFDRYTIQLWQFQTRYTPVIELLGFDLTLAGQTLAQLPLEFFIFDQLQGLIEFLPIPGSTSGQGLYSYMLANLSGYAHSLFAYGAVSRIPCFFTARYKTGLWNDSIVSKNDKEFIRQLITRRAVQKILPTIDPGMREGSKSEGIDGLNASLNYSGERYLNIFKAEEDENIKYLQKKFGRQVEMVVV